MKFNKKEVEIILIISLLISVVLIIMYFNYKNSKKDEKVDLQQITSDKVINNEDLKKNSFKYKNPSGYEYIYINDIPNIVSKEEGWMGIIETQITEPLKSKEEIYDELLKKYELQITKVDEVYINNNKVLVFDFNPQKFIVVSWISPWNKNYYINIYYSKDDFNINKLTPIIESLNNPLNLDEVLQNNNIQNSN